MSVSDSVSVSKKIKKFNQIPTHTHTDTDTMEV
jgi:hypothetical protein